MKREIKAEQKNQNAQSAVGIDQSAKPISDPPLKRAKMMDNNGEIIEQTISVKPSGTVFEETKSDLVVVPRNIVSVLPSDKIPLQKKARKSPSKAITDTREHLMEPIKPKKAIVPYVFFATEHSAMLRNEKNYTVVEAMKGAGAAWNKLSDQEKQKYVLMAQKDTER